ncbi:hypothetical protein ACQ4PT_013801 [Festuca glaucescens]
MASSSKPPFLIRFGAKRLRKFVDNELNDAKRAVIAMLCFADIARISKFHVPEELLEWVVMNIDPKLREYRHKVSKPILFTRDMLTKVFNVPSRGRPVERLKNSEHMELRNVYRDGDRAPIAYLERLLRECADDDVVMIKRSFALLAFATVLFLGTNNMVPLDYLGSLLDMDTVHEYAWDEAILAFCMDQVAEFQEKRRLQKEFVKQNPTKRAKQFSIGSCLPALIVYIDHLDFPVEQLHGHVFDYSVPRALHVCNDDFELAMAIDRNKKTLDIGVFGKRPIRDRCNTPYAIDQAPPAPQNVPFVQVQPAYQHPPVVQAYIAPHLPHVAPAQPVLQPSNVSQAQAAAHPFVEVDASVNGGEAFVEPCATLAEWLHNSIPPVGDLGVPTDFNAVYEKHKKLFKREFSAALSSFGLVVQGIQCNRMALLLKDVSDAARNASLQEGTNESNGISFDVPNLDPEAFLHGGVSMGGVGSSPAGATIIEDASVGIVGGFVIVIRGAIVSSVPVQTIDSTKDSSVPPRAPSPTHVAVHRSPSPSPVAADADLMDLSNKGAEGHEIFIREMTPANSVHSLPSPIFQSVASATTPSPTRSAGPTAAEFQQVNKIVDELTSGPSTHEKRTRHKRVAVDFDSAPKMKKVKINADADALYTKKCKKYAFSCLVTLYFIVIKDHHWILCTINLLHKQINIFDSMKGSKSSEALFRCVDNIIANFATLVKQTNIIKQDIALFARVNQSEYPQQKTNFDCGFFVILYMENFDGKIMKLFGLDYIPIFREIVAATLFNSPPNEIDAAVAIAEQAP